MRIGVNTLFAIPGEVGGTETYLRETLRAMANHNSGHDLVLFTNLENDPVLRADLECSTRVEFVPMQFRATNRANRVIREQVQLPSIARRARVDVLWSAGYTSPFTSHCPRVTTIHDMQYKSHPEDMNWLTRGVTGVLVKSAARRSRLVLAVSEFARAEIVRHTGIPAERVRVTLEAADSRFAADLDRRQAMETVSAAGCLSGPYLLVVSNTYPHKNIETAVRAFGRLQGKIPHSLVIVGRSRRGEAGVEEAIRQLPDPSRVKRIQYVESGVLVSFYVAADVFVFPSLYEGFGLPVLEAITAGAPVVTGRFGSIPEAGGNACVYVDSRSADALAEGIDAVLRWDTGTRARRVEQGRLFATGFSWSRTAARTLVALEEAAGSSR